MPRKNDTACWEKEKAMKNTPRRYVVGLPSGGTNEGTQGTPLTNIENRAVGQHTHALDDPGHSHASETSTSGGPSSGLQQAAFRTPELTLATSTTRPIYPIDGVSEKLVFRFSAPER
jgi:hypothetical protein